MKVGIIGLGLIGGSMCRAYHEKGHTVLGADIDEVTLGWAKLSGIINDKLDDSNIGTCDLLLIAILPDAASKWLMENSSKISSNTLVIDLCGNKRQICETGFELAKKTWVHICRWTSDGGISQIRYKEFPWRHV